MQSGGTYQLGGISALRPQIRKSDDSILRQKAIREDNRLWFHFRENTGTTENRMLFLTKTITPEYMPPELLIMLENGSNDHELLKKVDVWSIGCILLEILTGVPLWFRYKCKVEMKGRSVLQMGIFALTRREYSKIVRKQR